MKKVLLVISVISVLMLAGCNKNDDVNNTVNNNVSDVIENQNIEEDSIKGNSEMINNREQENIKSVVDVSSELVNVDEEACYHQMIITGHDFSGDTVWSYTTSVEPITELQTISLFHVGEDKVYLNVGGTIQVINKQTGELIWENSDFRGAGISYAFDDDERLYLSGYYGPFLCIIDSNGNTIKIIENDDYYWSERIYVNSTDGYVSIKCMMFDDNHKHHSGIVDINLENYQIEQVKYID